MKKWLKFFDHSQPNSLVEGMWQGLFINLLMSLIPFVFAAPLAATLTCAFLAVASLGFSLLGWRLYAPVSYFIGAILIVSLKSSMPHGAFSGEFFATAFAILALCKTFNLRTYGDGEIFLILTLAANSTVLMLDTDSSLLILIWTYGMIVWTVGNLLRINIKNFSSPALLASLRTAAQAALYTLPLLIFLFYIFQKFSHGVAYDQGESSIGLSRTLEPGKVSKLTSDSTIAMRVKMSKNDLPLVDLYWKGPVLSKSLGMRWEVLKNHKEIESPPKMGSDSCVVEQTIFIQRSEFSNGRFALDEPIPESYFGSLPYKVSSKICFEKKIIKRLSAKDRELYTRVDGSVTDELRAFALKIKGKSRTEQDFVSNIYRYFKGNDFAYSLTPATLTSNHPLDEFLFDTRQGFCEHYSAALATLARLAGIPARIVTGFQGGVYNSYGNYWIIGYRDSHAWVEIWENKRGWVREDPTGIVAPERIINGAKNLLRERSYSEKFHLDGIWMFIDAFYFWIRGIFDNRETLISLNDLTFNPFHLSALCFVLLCWLQVRRLSQDYTRSVQRQFEKLTVLLNERTLPRGRSEGFDNYRKRLLAWLDSQKNLRPLSPTIDRVLQRLIKLKYSSTGLTPHELESLYGEIKTVQRALRLKTNFFVKLQLKDFR